MYGGVYSTDFPDQPAQLILPLSRLTWGSVVRMCQSWRRLKYIHLIWNIIIPTKSPY